MLLLLDVFYVYVFGFACLIIKSSYESKKAFVFSDFSEEDEGFQILRVTTSLADSIAVSLSVTSSSSSGLFCILAASRLNMRPDNGGLPVPTTSCDIFI